MVPGDAGGPLPWPGLPFLPAAPSLRQGARGQSGVSGSAGGFSGPRECVPGMCEYDGWTDTGERPRRWEVAGVLLGKPLLESRL